MKWTKEDLPIIKAGKLKAIERHLWKEAYEWRLLQAQVEEALEFKNDERYFIQGYAKWTQFETKLGYIVHGHN